ncbi:MAG: hypothetical protein ACSNEK_08140 [Parachlamydiaceae bacterium]
MDEEFYDFTRCYVCYFIAASRRFQTSQLQLPAMRLHRGTKLWLLESKPAIRKSSMLFMQKAM